jgi:hypothetical protein
VRADLRPLGLRQRVRHTTADVFDAAFIALGVLLDQHLLTDRLGGQRLRKGLTVEGIGCHGHLIWASLEFRVGNISAG